jgi:hypothetical protein
MMNNRVTYTYINKYLNSMKNNSNVADKSFCVVITGMINYTMYMKLQKYIYYRREDPADPSALPTSQTEHPPEVWHIPPGTPVCIEMDVSVFVGMYVPA